MRARAARHLSRLVERVSAGESIVIARAGRPVAELRAYQRPDFAFGGLADEFTFDDSAFSSVADREVREMFQDDPGLDVPR